MRKITIVAAMLKELSPSAFAQIGVDTDNRVGHPGTTKGTGQNKPSFFDTYESGENVKSPRDAGGTRPGRRQHEPDGTIATVAAAVTGAGYDRHERPRSRRIAAPCAPTPVSV